jgi:hypothetical protein
VEPLIDALTPYSDTPLVRSMVAASADFKGAQGFKTMVVLTDGQDTRFEKGPGYAGDPVINPPPQKTIPQFLQEKFGNSDIALRVIGFQLPADEIAEAKRQFEVPLKKLRKEGRFYLVNKTPELIKALRESMPQRLFFSLQDINGELVEGYKRGLDISREGPGETFPADLPPAYYYVDIDTIQPPLRQKIEIKRGQGLRLGLLQTPTGFVLQRELIADTVSGAENFPGTKETKDWRVTVRENQMGNTADDPLHMKVSIEYLKSRVRSGSGDVLGQVSPSLVLFEVKQQDNAAKMPALRYRPAADFVAPSWQLEARPWPRNKNVAPVLDAFWSDDEHPLPVAVKIDLDGFNVPPGAQFKAVLNPLNGEEGIVRLLSLGMEKHKVDTYDGGQQLMDCLVVRLEYPKDRPVLVQLLTEKSVGQEHRFYSKANKYTGIFWGLTKQEAELSVRALRVISVEGFRQAAMRAESKRHVSLKLSPP